MYNWDGLYSRYPTFHTIVVIYTVKFPEQFALKEPVIIFSKPIYLMKHLVTEITYKNVHFIVMKWHNLNNGTMAYKITNTTTGSVNYQGLYNLDFIFSNENSNIWFLQLYLVFLGGCFTNSKEFNGLFKQW